MGIIVTSGSSGERIKWLGLTDLMMPCAHCPACSKKLMLEL